MNDLVARANAAWTALGARERFLITLTLFVAPLLLIYTLFVEPAVLQLNAVRDREATLQQDVSSLDEHLSLLRAAKLPDLDARLASDVKALQARVDALNAELNTLSRSLVDPAEMLVLLRSVLNAESGLVIAAARSLPVERVGDSAQGGQQDEADSEELRPRVYKHGFELELEGTYDELYRYLMRLEALNAGFYWDSLRYDTSTYPDARIQLRVHTLSTEESWLGS